MNFLRRKPRKFNFPMYNGWSRLPKLEGLGQLRVRMHYFNRRQRLIIINEKEKPATHITSLYSRENNRKDKENRITRLGPMRYR